MPPTPLVMRIKSKYYGRVCWICNARVRAGKLFANVQWVHKDVNEMKKGLTEERFHELCELVIKHRITP